MAAALEKLRQHPEPEDSICEDPVEHPFAALKYHLFGHPRFLLRGLRGAQTEISLGVMAYNLKRMVNAVGATAHCQACLA